MPRNPNNRNEFIAGNLRVISFNRKRYFVDGRMKELRNVNDFMDKIIIPENVLVRDYRQGSVRLSKQAQRIINYEFFGFHEIVVKFSDFSHN